MPTLCDLRETMLQNDLCIRPVPGTCRHIFEVNNTPDAPLPGQLRGQTVISRQGMYLDEYKRDMLIVKTIPPHAGQFIATSCRDTGQTVKFSGPLKYYGTLEEIIQDYKI